MCEYTPECTNRDDPDALRLWTSAGRNRASWLVLCPKEYHPIAAVFDLPTRGRVLCTPLGFALHRSLFVDPQDPEATAHLHAGLLALTDYGEEESEYGRCRCGTWHYRPAKITSRLFGHNDHGQPYTLTDFVAPADSADARHAREAPDRN